MSPPGGGRRLDVGEQLKQLVAEKHVLSKAASQTQVGVATRRGTCVLLVQLFHMMVAHIDMK